MLLVEDKYLEKAHKRFSNKIVYLENGCWIWDGVINSAGYGCFRFKDKMVLAHRFSYEQILNKIPKGRVIDHLCRNRDCVNPEHMDVVTNKENLRRGNTGLHNKIKTHCPKGHEYSKKNTYIYKNRRTCKECERIRKR